jgi:protein TonB
MRRTVAAILFALAAAVSSAAQTGARPEAVAARQEIDAGSRLYRAGKFAEAEARFRRALELDPEGKDTRTFIARAAHRQYRPGDETPENLAAGERAAAAYHEVLAKDPANDDAYRAVMLLYRQMKQEERARELLLGRANDFSAPAERRAEAFATLAAEQWGCSFKITERPANKKTVEKTAESPGGVVYTAPSDAGDLIRARQCVTDGLQFAQQAVALAPRSQNAQSHRANLLREAAKLAEMEGDAGQKAEYDRQYKEAQEALVGTKNEMAGDMASPSQTPQPKRTMVTGGILNGKAVSKPMPAYPPEAKAAGVQGTVVVRIVIDEGGGVIEASAVSGPELLREAAVAAARRARFSPTLLSGQPVKVTGHVTYNFVIQ